MTTPTPGILLRPHPQGETLHTTAQHIHPKAHDENPSAEPASVHLVALLAGLGGRAADVAAELDRPATVGAGHTCIDGGGGTMLAVRAPGPRLFEAQSRRRPAAQPNGSELWHGLLADSDGVIRRWTRTIWPGRSGGPPAGDDRPSAVLADYGRIWSVQRDDSGRSTAVSWQLHRSCDVGDVLDRAGIGNSWAPAATAFDDLHGFAASATAGPWSVTLRDDPGDPAPVIRLGTTRWAWSVDDSAKRGRLAGWISSFGGDGAYAAALHHLLVGDPSGRRPRSVGRAVEIDVVGAAIVAVAAYLVIPSPVVRPATPQPAWRGSIR